MSNGFSAGLWSAASAAVTFGIGSTFGHSLGSLSNELWRAGAHSLSSGTFSYLQGGSFWRGAASGGLSSLAGSGLEGIGADQAQTLMGTSAVGGLGSMISGGGFWQGFGTGLAIGAFNHLLADLADLYDWKSPHAKKYRIHDQGDDPTCHLACGASILESDIPTLRAEFEKVYGPISKDGTRMDLFIKFMEGKGYNYLIGPQLGKVGYINLGENLQNGYHTIETYPESGGHHSVLVTRIRITKKLEVKMTYFNSQNGGTQQTSTFPITELILQQFWK